MRYRFLTTPWRVALFAAVSFAVASGVPALLIGGPLVASIAVAGGAGVVFGALCGMISRRPLHALDGLSPADREIVARTVAKGLPPPDRRLAPAVVRYADAMRSQNRGWMNAGRNSWVLFALAGVQALGAVSDALDQRWWGVALRSSVAVLLLATPPVLRRNNDRLDAAELAARALLAED